MNNEKDKNSYPSQNTHILSHLGTDKSFVFQYRKAEKILAALYLVTNFINEHEPIRRDIRENGLSILSDIMSLKDSLPAQKDELCNIIKSTLVKMVSLLDISTITGLISKMNSEVLKNELASLLGSVSSSKQVAESLLIPDNFFELSDQEIAGNIVENNQKQASLVSSETKAERSYFVTKKPEFSKKKYEEKRVEPGVVDLKRNTRQAIILDILKKKKEVMVKDISDVIRDCSEKTLQRELLAMVEKGILKKEGERRWSRYSIA